MTPKPKQTATDKREIYYRDRVRQHGQRYRQFHLPSVEVLLNLAYTYDVTATHLARAIGKHGLSLSSFNLLMILSRNGGEGCPLYEIGELLLVSRANVTGLVDSLERKGLVERVADKRDRRVRVARITKAGGTLLESLLPEHYLDLRKICSRLNTAEKASLGDLLTKLRNSVQFSLDNKGPGKKP